MCPGLSWLRACTCAWSCLKCHKTHNNGKQCSIPSDSRDSRILSTCRCLPHNGGSYRRNTSSCSHTSGNSHPTQLHAHLSCLRLWHSVYYPNTDAALTGPVCGCSNICSPTLDIYHMHVPMASCVPCAATHYRLLWQSDLDLATALYKNSHKNSLYLTKMGTGLSK